MGPELTERDVELILTALDYTRRAYQNTKYPTADLRREQFEQLDETVRRVRVIRDPLKEG